MHKIRLATSNDAPEIGRMIKACQSPNPSPNSAQIFCAELNGNITGITAVHATSANSAEVSCLFVEPEHRLQGIGRSLMDRITEHVGPGRELTLLARRDTPEAFRFFYPQKFQPSDYVTLRRTT